MILIKSLLFILIHIAAVACANFVDASKVKANSTSKPDSSSSMATQKATATGSNSNQASSTSSGFAVATAAPIVGAGLLGLAALLL